ncbi:cupin domain-containing protein [Kineosporia succinea]|uniref:Mannose-6-phosphate isomerase-like protein (Cupin superfamily) n=1 Tax=Kineosporia succinea TaxID=84632 RepID=A0ABT9P8M2_9ACTN|nr:cupin domain-containing protein [Kineosporia succinea]MDP9829038.1 mannose-6-phosphate isomerase-like protein (cupin superfamily) [Kineosporia succinea]
MTGTTPSAHASAQPFWFLGGRARILVPGEETHGAASVVEFADPRDHATPLHIHEAEDEVWVVLEGEISFHVGDDRLDLRAGQVAHGPRGVPHAYRVRSAGSLMAVTFAPAGIEKWFRQNSSPVLSLEDAPAAFDIGAIVAAAEPFRLRVAGPPPA